MPKPATFTEAIRQVVAERPDFVYSSPNVMDGTCVYRDPKTGEPSCLIGVALDRMGELPSLDDLGRGSFLGLNTKGPHSLVESFHLPLTVEETEAALRAQNVQDRGLPWATALEAYEAAL